MIHDPYRRDQHNHARAMRRRTIAAADPLLAALQAEIDGMTPPLTAPSYGVGLLMLERRVDAIVAARYPRLASVADSIHRHFAGEYSSAAVRAMLEGVDK